MILYMKYLIMFLLLFYILYKPNIKLIRNPDIILSPGGLLGFYVLGICHFIKNNYDLSGKKYHRIFGRFIEYHFFVSRQTIRFYFFETIVPNEFKWKNALTPIIK